MLAPKLLPAIAVLASVTNAQYGDRPEGFSDTCFTQFKAFSLTKLNECLQIPLGMTVSVGTIGNSSIVDMARKYLDVFCSSDTPACPADLIESAVKGFEEYCVDHPWGSLTGMSRVMVQYYDSIRPTACLRNATTNAFCAIEAFETFEAESNPTVNVSDPFLYNAFNNAEETLMQIEQVFSTGKLCTGCVSKLLNSVRQMNFLGGVMESPLIKFVETQCGAGFGSSSSISGILSLGETASKSAAPVANETSAVLQVPSAAASYPLYGGLLSGAMMLTGLSLFCSL